MKYSVQDIFNKFGNIYLDNYNPNYHKLNIYNKIMTCRTKKTGVNIYKCKDCGKQIYTYKSCMDRHCSTCLDYKKEPYNSVNDIYEYFGKYAFKVCITNERIKKIDDKYVYFTYKNYDNKNEEKISKVKGEEFIRRYLTHILNKSFIKIRYYGIMSCKNKTKKMKKLRIITKTKRIKDRLIDKINLLKKILGGKDITKSPKCNGKLYLYKEVNNNKSPPKILHKDVLV